MIAKERPPALGWRSLRLAIYLATLVCPISMPSLRSSPWIRGAPHKELAMLISRISLRISVATVGRPPRRRDFHRQYDVNPARCHLITVSGFTIAADWIANQITEACGWEQAPRYLIRDRDGPMVRSSSEGFDQWAFAIDRRRRAPLGRMDMLKG
jgi:hypothetical protein